MATSRRAFLAGAAALALAPQVSAATSAGFLAARGAGDRFVVSRFGASGAISYDVELPDRGHDIAVASRLGLGVAVARRPGQFLVAFDLATGEIRQKIAAAPGYFFCGHAEFDPACRLLYATETREEDGAGYIGVYDVGAGFRRIAAWPTGGDDPHELAIVGETIVVANGGFGLDRSAPLEPSLVRLGAKDGHCHARATPPDGLRQVSLRHLAVVDGTIWVAGQHAGPATSRPPLLAAWDGTGDLRFIDLPDAALVALRNYCGSIAADGAGQLCVTSPHGGNALILDRAATVVDRLALADVCGVAALDGGGFLLTGGRGDVRTTEGAQVQVPGARWDNHIARIA